MTQKRFVLFNLIIFGLLLPSVLTAQVNYLSTKGRISQSSANGFAIYRVDMKDLSETSVKISMPDNFRIETDGRVTEHRDGGFVTYKVRPRPTGMMTVQNAYCSLKGTPGNTYCTGGGCKNGEICNHFKDKNNDYCACGKR